MSAIVNRKLSSFKWNFDGGHQNMAVPSSPENEGNESKQEDGTNKEKV